MNRLSLLIAPVGFACLALAGCGSGRILPAVSASALSSLVVVVNAPTQAAVAQAYQGSLSASGGKAPYTFAVLSGALPSGLSLGALSGAVSGTPVAAGLASFVVHVVDATGSAAADVPFSMSVLPQPTLTLQAGQTTLASQRSAAISVSVSGNSAAAPLTWTLDGACASACGSIQSSGPLTALYTAPAIASPTGVSIHAASAVGGVAAGALALALVPPPAIVTTSLPAVTAGSAFSAQLVAQGGIGAYHWSLAPGSLPAGLTLDPQSGSLQGTPLIGGAFPLQIQLRDGDQPAETATQGLTLVIADAPVTAAAAARLLEQGTFGSTADTIAQVQKAGLKGYLQQQFAAAQTILPLLGRGSDSDPAPNPICQDYTGCNAANWWQIALYAPDQLRQRVAFALSDIFVVSDRGVDARALPLFYNTLIQDAFGNYRALMGDVSLNPAMGVYLSMIGNTTVFGGEPNQNYAREMMQLFSLGTVLLNEDGSPALGSDGKAVPTYTQEQVEGFAAAYTGWTWAMPDGSNSGTFNIPINWIAPMAAAEPFHDHGAKVLLNGTTLPAGQGTAKDLNGALDNIFQHGNLPPFVSLRLIQNLVTAQPSAAYVQRVAAVFKDNGHGVRGDLQAVIQAILLDAEARAGDLSLSSTGGHLKQPLLWETGALRGLGANPSTVQAYVGLDAYGRQMGQGILDAPSVFGYYDPASVLPGTTTVSPEFGLDTTALSVSRLSVTDALINLGANGFVTDLTANGPLYARMQKDPAGCIAWLNTVLMHGAMPAALQKILLDQTATLSDTASQLRLAVYLILTSNEFRAFY